ncbi:MAG: type-F conjugative transfer system secretin TraK [Legionellales bacterium]|nr:type-F conjugative transfer system secretin TraK [Legionellales bacterium]
MRNKIIGSMMAALFFSSSAIALQTVNVIDNASVHATVFNGSYNRIIVQGERINNVIGTPASYVIETDNILGQIYIKPLQTANFELNISTEQGNAYQIKLNVKKGSPDTIVLQPPVTTPEQAENWESATPYEATLTRLIQAMATGTFPDGYTVVFAKDKNPLPLGNVATVTPITQYQGINLEGDVYIIRNLTNESLNLRPEQLYRKGTMAIALQTEAIPAKGQTRLFMVKQGANHD